MGEGKFVMGEGKFVMGEGKYVMGEEKFDRDKSDYGLRYHPVLMVLANVFSETLQIFPDSSRANPTAVDSG